MRNAIAATFVTLAATIVSAPVIASSDHDGHAGMRVQASAEAQMAEGVVKKVDKSAGKVTLAHSPLTNLGMPAMTMVFRVKDVAWLDQMKDGDKVRFMADKVNGAITIIHFEQAK